MNKKLFFSVVLMLSSACAICQDLDVLVNAKGKMGFADANGTEVIKCQYDNVSPFRDGASVVSKSGKYGMIGVDGAVILPLQYSTIRPWTDNLYLIQKGKTMGLVNLSGKVVLDCSYSIISNLNCYGKALIGIGGKQYTYEGKQYMSGAKYGIIDENGDILIPAQYKGLYEFTYDGSASTAMGRGLRSAYSYHFLTDTLITDCEYLAFSDKANTITYAGIIDGKGKVLMPQNEHDLIMKPMNGMARYYDRLKSGTEFGYYNLESGKTLKMGSTASALDDIKVCTHYDFYGEISAANGSTWTIVNKNGEAVKSNCPGVAYSELFNLWMVKNAAGTIDVMDNDGRQVDVLCGYENMFFPTIAGDAEVFSVCKNGKYGLVDRTGNVLIPFNYDMMGPNTHGVVAVRQGDNWGCLNLAGAEVVPVAYSNFLLPSEDGATQYWVQQTDKKWYHYNTTNKKLASMGYKQAWNFQGDYAFVVLEGVDEAYATLTDVNDEIVMTTPVVEKYRQPVLDMVKSHAAGKMTPAQINNIVLMMTRAERQYEMGATIPQSDWDY